MPSRNSPMDDALLIYDEGLSSGLRPPTKLTVSEWADVHRVLPQRASAEPGRWRTSRTPYLQEIMDNLSSSSPAETVVLMKGSQVGGTECGNNWLGYIIHHAPGPAMMVLPTVEMAKRSSKQRIAPMIEECAQLQERVKDPRSRDSGNTMLAKEFPGGILIMTGANSAVGLRSMPVRYLFLDEIDGYTHDVDGEGDPVELAVKRTATFARSRKVFVCSTPTIRGVSRIEVAYDRSDQRVYKVPCPDCGHEQQIQWRNLKWPKGKPAEVAMACEGCEVLIPEHKKGWMLARGRWVATAESDGKTIGYHLNSLYSPLGWYPWAQAVEDFLSAKQQGREALKTWTNTVLAETWEEESDSVPEAILLSRREKYAAEVPHGVLVLTAGVDVQDDRLEVEIVGWGKGEESWAVDYVVLWGDPGGEELWTRLDDVFARKYEWERGGHHEIIAVAVDTGGHYTQQVYEYCRAREYNRMYAVKGMAGTGRPIVTAPSRRGSGSRHRGVNLFTVGVDSAKGLLYSRLKLRTPGPGYCHFPDDDRFGQEYFAQLTAEKVVTRYQKGFPRREWVKVRPRNEALDCRVYALAAMYILNPVWDAIDERLDHRAAVERGDADPPPATRQRRRSDWVTRWKDRY